MEQEEKQKLEQAKERFHLQELTKDQAEYSIGRNFYLMMNGKHTLNRNIERTKNLKTTFIRLSTVKPPIAIRCRSLRRKMADCPS